MSLGHKEMFRPVDEKKKKISESKNYSVIRCKKLFDFLEKIDEKLY